VGRQAGLAALAIRWDDGPNAKLSTADIVRGLAKASEAAGVTARKDGDPMSALAGAAKKVEAVYESPFLAHVTMEADELHGSTCGRTAASVDRLTGAEPRAGHGGRGHRFPLERSWFTTICWGAASGAGSRWTT